MASSVMHFYAMNYSEFLKLPYYTFWELARNTNRIKASDDLRLLTLLSNAFNGPADYSSSLIDERGVVVEQDEAEVDFAETRNGLLELRAMIGGL